MRFGTGRVFIGPEPEDGSHEGYQGHIGYDEIGIHLEPASSQWLCPVDGNWEPVWDPLTVPWHRVYLIEWSDRYEIEEEADQRCL